MSKDSKREMKRSQPDRKDSEEPSRKRKASPEPSRETKRAKVVPETEAGTSSDDGIRKGKASPDKNKDRKRAKVEPEAEAGTSSDDGPRQRKKVQDDREGPKRARKSLRRRLLDQQVAASSSATTSREEPTRKRKASPEPSRETKRAKVVPETEAGTSSDDGTRKRQKVQKDGEGLKKKTRKSPRRRLLDEETASSSAATSRESGSDPLEGCSHRGEKRKAAEADEAPPKKKSLQVVQDRTELSEEEQRAQFDSKYEQQQQQLGKGSCGSVFAGLRKCDSLPVAIKRVPKSNVFFKHVDHNGKEISTEVAAMLKIQAGSSGSVGASAPITLLDWYDLDQELILVLERPVPSEDLFYYVKNNGDSLEEEEAKIIMKQLIEAAMYLEKKGIFHRDIRCDNILIETGSDVPRVRLLDFGMCCFTKEQSSEFCETYCLQTYLAGPTTVFQMGVVLLDMLRKDDQFGTITYNCDEVQISDELSKDCQDFLKKCLTMVSECRPRLRELLHHPWLR